MFQGVFVRGFMSGRGVFVLIPRANGHHRVLVRKPLIRGVTQTPRFVVDYQKLNSVTVGDGYPIPSVDNILDAICNGKHFGKLDLASGYWQVLLNPRDTAITAFSMHLGLYEFFR